jgi:hypothetical protein
MVWQVFEHLALGEPLENFPKYFPGRVSLAAAREALQLGKLLFARNGDTWERAVASLERISWTRISSSSSGKLCGGIISPFVKSATN